MPVRYVVGLGNPGPAYARSRHNIGWEVVEALRGRWDFPDFSDVLSPPGVAVTDGKFTPPPLSDSEKPVPMPVQGGLSTVWLVKPLNYMNRSGRSFAAWLDTQPESGLDAASRAAWSPPPPDENDDSPLDPEVDPFATDFSDEDETGTDPSDTWKSRQALARARCASILVVVDDFRLPLGRVRFRPDGSDGGHNGLSDMAAALGTEAYPRLRVGVGIPPPGVSHIDWVLRPLEGEDAIRWPLVAAFAADAVACWVANGFVWARDRFNGASLGE